MVSAVMKDVCRLIACRLKSVKDGEQPETRALDQYVRDWKSRLNDTYKVAPQALTKVRVNRKRLYDGRTRPKVKRKFYGSLGKQRTRRRPLNVTMDED